ncbi:MAG: type II toxin-antitoxin system RelE/ParE family toxin [Candidatus Gottesmanbacteria bacterium]|nr:type II toxin-antitoxin system RelE/ParE family toxin [Candidatus Gottesmanbacteria bacterium]
MRVHNDPRVDKEIRALPRKNSARIVQVSELFKEHGFGLTELHLKKITKNVWELRSGRWRLFFGMVGQTAVIVQILFKKTQKTPSEVIRLAEKRLREYL